MLQEPVSILGYLGGTGSYVFSVRNSTSTGLFSDCTSSFCTFGNIVRKTTAMRKPHRAAETARISSISLRFRSMKPFTARTNGSVLPNTIYARRARGRAASRDMPKRRVRSAAAAEAYPRAMAFSCRNSHVRHVTVQASRSRIHVNPVRERAE